MTEQTFLDQKIVNKLKKVSRKQEIIENITVVSLCAIAFCVAPLVELIKSNLWISIYVFIGIGFSFLFLWYLYVSYIHLMRRDLAGWSPPHQQYEITFTDGNRCNSKNLIEDFQIFYRKIASVKLIEKK